jgi:hypothetical protein
MKLVFTVKASRFAVTEFSLAPVGVELIVSVDNGGA